MLHRCVLRVAVRHGKCQVDDWGSYPVQTEEASHAGSASCASATSIPQTKKMQKGY